MKLVPGINSRALVWRRKLTLKAKLESGSPYHSRKLKLKAKFFEQFIMSAEQELPRLVLEEVPHGHKHVLVGGSLRTSTLPIMKQILH